MRKYVSWCWIILLPCYTGWGQTGSSEAPQRGPTFAPLRTVVTDSSGQLGSAAGNATDCVLVDGSSRPCSADASVGDIKFVEGERPAGVDGVNLVFTLAYTPVPASSLLVFRNGVKLQAGTDYTLQANRLTMQAAQVPATDDGFECYYRTITTTTSTASRSMAVPASQTGAASAIVHALSETIAESAEDLAERLLRPALPADEPRQTSHEPAAVDDPRRDNSIRANPAAPIPNPEPLSVFRAPESSMAAPQKDEAVPSTPDRRRLRRYVESVFRGSEPK